MLPQRFPEGLGCSKRLLTALLATRESETPGASALCGRPRQAITRARRPTARHVSSRTCTVTCLLTSECQQLCRSYMSARKRKRHVRHRTTAHVRRGTTSCCASPCQDRSNSYDRHARFSSGHTLLTRRSTRRREVQVLVMTNQIQHSGGHY